MLRNFYRKAVANYPACREHLHIHWIFDACVESLGKDRALAFFENLQADLNLYNSLSCGILCTE